MYEVCSKFLNLIQKKNVFYGNTATSSKSRKSNLDFCFNFFAGEYHTNVRSG